VRCRIVGAQTAHKIKVWCDLYHFSAHRRLSQ